MFIHYFPGVMHFDVRQSRLMVVSFLRLLFHAFHIQSNFCETELNIFFETLPHFTGFTIQN